MTPNPSPVLSARGVSVDLDGRRVLRRADLTVHTGEFVVLLGSNGSGKSTLVRAVTGLVPRTEGEIELFGTPLERFRDRRRLGYVPQRAHTTAGVPATVTEVVMSGRLAHRRLVGWSGREDRAAVADAIERVGLADRARSAVTALSGGQHQRVLIARALASRAELLVMDEPTAGVDHDNVESLATLLGSLVTDGATVLLVAHELGPMRPLVDRAVVIRDGSVAYDGPVDHVRGEDHTHVHHHAEEPTAPEALGGEGVWP